MKKGLTVAIAIVTAFGMAACETEEEFEEETTPATRGTPTEVPQIQPPIHEADTVLYDEEAPPPEDREEVADPL